MKPFFSNIRLNLKSHEAFHTSDKFPFNEVTEAEVRKEILRLDHGTGKPPHLEILVLDCSKLQLMPAPLF